MRKQIPGVPAASGLAIVAASAHAADTAAKPAARFKLLPFGAGRPAGFAAKNEWRPQVGHLVDVMTPCVDGAGAKCPPEFNGKSILPMEGKSLGPAFANKPIARAAVFWEHAGTAADESRPHRVAQSRGEESRRGAGTRGEVGGVGDSREGEAVSN